MRRAKAKANAKAKARERVRAKARARARARVRALHQPTIMEELITPVSTFLRYMTAQLLIDFVSGQGLMPQAQNELPTGWTAWALGTQTMMAIVRAVQLGLKGKEYNNSKKTGSQE